MKRIIILFFLVLPMLLFSQSEEDIYYTISGKIIDSKTKQPLEAASIVFRNNDEIKSGGITNYRGHFSIEVAKGKYNATVEYFSYKTKQLSITSINKNLNIGTVELEINQNVLDEIQIVAEKKNIEITPKKIIVNVSKDITAEGGLATDVLNNIPSVSVDDDGSVNLRGQATTVMINGRVSSLSKSEALKSIPAGSIDKIELITNPGASYAASYTSIINIILKKGKDNGFNSSITVTSGFKDYYGALVTLNYKTKKYNLYSNLSYGHSNPISTASYETEYFEDGITSSYLNEYNESDKINNNWNGTLGIEIYASDKTTITPEINYYYLDYKTNSETYTEFLNESKVFELSNNRNYLINYKDKIAEYSLNFSHNFDEEKSLDANFSFSNDMEDFDKIITNTNEDFTNEDYIEENKLNSTDINVQYNQSLSENKAYAIGYEGIFGNSTFFNTEEDAINSIDYIEDTHAAFIEFENQIDKFYYGIGLRAELNKISVNYSDLNTKQTKKYEDLFPSVYLSYDFKNNKSLVLSASKSIARPDYYRLQPFEEKYSETSSYIGNENLEPLYIYQNQLTYAYYGSKITVMPSFIYTIYENYWQNVTYTSGEEFNGVDKLISTVANVGDFKYYGLNLAIQYNPNKVLSFSSNILLNGAKQTGIFTTTNTSNETIEIDYTNENFSGNFSLLTQIKIPKLFNFQTNINHFLESEGAVSVRKAYTYASAAITKDLFNKNATVGLNVNDIFLSRETDRDRYDDDYFQHTLTKNKYRTIKLSFTYRFNQSKKQRKVDFDTKDIKPNY